MKQLRAVIYIGFIVVVCGVSAALAQCTSGACSLNNPALKSPTHMTTTGGSVSAAPPATVSQGVQQAGGLAGSSTASTSNNSDNKGTTGPAAAADPDLVIGKGDLLQVSVFGAPDYDYQVRVGNSGVVSLPLIGETTVAGMTIQGAQKMIEKRLADGGYFSTPRVSIFVRDYATESISVLGEVQKPGMYPLLGNSRLLDVISAAGGTTPKAGMTATITHRATPDNPETIHLPLGATDAKNNVQVQPGDTVMVAKAGIVYVVGDVKMPSGIVMDKPQITILQAIAMAQGVNPTASLSGARLIRRTPAGPQEVPVALQKILQAKAPDLPLQADDIIFIPNSKGKSALHRTMEAVIQAATGVAIYRP